LSILLKGFTGGEIDYENREAMWTSQYDNTTEMYQHFSKLNKARSAIGSASASFYTDKASIAATTEHEIAVAKGSMLSVLSNRGSGSGSASTMNIPNLSYDANTQLLDVVSCNTSTTKSDKSLDVVVQDGAPQVYIPASFNSDNSICSTTAATTGSGSGSGNSGAGFLDAQVPFLGGLLAVVAGIAMTAC